MTGALDGLLVIELGHVLAGPFAATLLGDFGAEVIKIERPAGGDGQRTMGPAAGSSPLWFSVLGRNKKSVTLDIKTPEGNELLRRMLARADVLVENFKPGTLERLGFSPADLETRNPGLVVLRISGFGQIGPYSGRRGFGKVAEAFSGATNLTGQPDQVPVHPGYSLGDLTAGMMGAMGVLLALQSRHATGRGQVIDLALYEALFRMIEWQIPITAATGSSIARSGNKFPFSGAFSTDVYRTRDGQFVAVSASSPRLIMVLDTFVRERVAGVPEPSPAPARELTDALGQWISTRDAAGAIDELDRAGIIAGLVNTPEDLLADPHVAARRNIVTVADADGTPISMPNAMPSLSRTPGEVHWPAPALGAHTDEVLRDLLGVSTDRRDDLRAKGII
ncbi:CaiB/BaiF CoA transferase family protein [Actinophytocola sp.]|uniref:CaiB/BaiF CoA transferase family protein n=1 Tax=Actinophytocola sp. TaxID=1872138 RepID=UPI003D6B0292